MANYSLYKTVEVADGGEIGGVSLSHITRLLGLERFNDDDIDMLIECTTLPSGAKAEDYEHMLEVHEQLKKLKEAK